MPFDCFGCICDAADHFCVEITPGAQLVPQLADEACPDSKLFDGGCVPFADECQDDPSCDCLGMLPGACWCKKGITPVHVTCPAP